LTSSCQKNLLKKKGEFDIGISFPKFFWHLETKKKGATNHTKVIFEKTCPNFTIF
jgi:hypothetical protein